MSDDGIISFWDHHGWIMRIVVLVIQLKKWISFATPFGAD